MQGDEEEAAVRTESAQKHSTQHGSAFARTH